jgi:uncharacterized protein
MLRAVLSVSLAVCASLFGPSWADTRSIRALLEKGENQQALELARSENSTLPEVKHLMALAMIRLANQRSIANPDSDFWLAQERQGVEQLLSSAAEAGYAPAMFDYAILLSFELDDFTAESLGYLASAAKKGDPSAVQTLYHRYCSGSDIPLEASEIQAAFVAVTTMKTDTDAVANFFSMFIAEDDDVFVQGAKRSLASNLATGSCGRLDKLEARRIFDSLTQEEDQFWVTLNLGTIVDQFKGESYGTSRSTVTANPSEAFDWLKYKIRSGRASYSDYTDIAEALLTGTGTPKDFESAKSAVAACYREAKVRENIYCLPSSINTLASDMLTASSSAATSLTQSEKQALKSILGTIALEEATDTDFMGWFYAANLGDQYAEGNFGTPDLKQAVEWYRVAATSGSVRSQFKLGYLFSSGEGVTTDGEEAARYYKMAAANGDSTAAHNLGWLYAYSGLVTKDDVEATSWYKKAAELDDLDAMAQLGKRTSEGLGTLENDREAVRWLTKAAEAGQKFAQYDLAIMLSNGEGAESNFVAAYKWANLAGASGVDASSLKSWLVNRMTREEVERAQNLSAVWKPKPLEDSQTSSSGNSDLREAGNTQPDELTLEIQIGLKDLGFLRGSADGIYGPKTRSAIEAFQRQQGVEVSGIVTPQLAVLIGRALQAAPRENGRWEDAGGAKTTGTGFVVSSSGHIVTNAHVVTACKKMTLSNGKLLTLQAYDPATDLALLKSSSLEGISPLPLRFGNNLEVSEAVAVAGFPLSGLLSPELNVTLGNISALSGPDGTRSLIQITAPVQPGNSGGPILDESGNVVGVVVSKLDAIAVATLTGDIPQNVNFGISLGELKSFLATQKVQFATKPASSALKSAEVGKIARASTFQIQCH